jgi:cell division septum initiation protein DivIVA
MTDQSLRRADDLLTELVDLVETARTVPMSSSCVVPREQLLDLLDDLREVLPPEMEEARHLVAHRDSVLAEAQVEAEAARTAATADATKLVQDARDAAAALVSEAEVRAYQIVEDGKAEHASLVSATRVHQEASRAAAELSAQAEEYDQGTRAAADLYRQQTETEANRYSADVRAEAERYAVKLMADSDDYADRTLAEMAMTMQRAAATAEQGRATIAARRAPAARPQPGSGDWGEAQISA